MIFRASALADLNAIARYFDAIDRDVTIRITADIERTIARLREFPLSGQEISDTRLRRITSKRYRFAVSYFVTTERIAIVGVFRFQNRRA